MIKQEPFGAILWHRRIEDNIPLCQMAYYMGVSVKELSEYELGWRIPPSNVLDIFCFAWMYGLTGAEELAQMKQSVLEARKVGPLDLTEYLGITGYPFSPPRNTPVYRPKQERKRYEKIETIQPYQPVLTTRFNDDRPIIRFDASYVPEKLKRFNAHRASEPDNGRIEYIGMENGAVEDETKRRIITPKAIEQKQLYSARAPEEQSDDRPLNRIYVEVAASKTGNVCELPREILWKDGKHFTIDTVLSAERNAVLRTGGVGIHYLCQIRGQQRHLCMEEDHRWFIESEKVV